MSFFKNGAAAAMLFCFATACAYPVSSTQQGGDMPAVYFSDFPVDAVAYIDGVSVGPASAFDGESGVLETTPGAHAVTVTANGETIFEREIFVGRSGALEIKP